VEPKNGSPVVRDDPCRFFLGEDVPLYSISEADLAHEVLVTKADAFHKSAGMRPRSRPSGSPRTAT
jgi:hypothetical protein